MSNDASPFDSSNHRGGRDGVQRRARTTSGAQRQPAPTGISPPVIRRSMTGRVGIVPGMFGYLPVAAVRRAIRVAIDAHSGRRTRTMGSTNSSGGIRPREEKLEPAEAVAAVDRLALLDDRRRQGRSRVRGPGCRIGAVADRPLPPRASGAGMTGLGVARRVLRATSLHRPTSPIWKRR